MRTKNIFNARTLLAFTFIAGAAIAAHPAQAKNTPFQTPAQLKLACAAVGGNYLSPAGHGRVYTCHLSDGMFIACGGKGPYARTCEDHGEERTIHNPILVRGGAVLIRIEDRGRKCMAPAEAVFDSSEIAILQ